jgi:hypothetical protein
MYENLGLTNNLEKAVEATTDWVTGYFQDGDEPTLTESAADMEAFISSHDHPIRDPTVKVIPDAEHFMKIYYQPAYDVELLSVSGLITGAFRVVVLSVFDKDRQQIRDEGEQAGGSALSHDIKADTAPGRSLKLSWLWCENSMWCSTYNAQVHRKKFGFDGSDPNKKMVSIPNANHFVCSFITSHFACGLIIYAASLGRSRKVYRLRPPSHVTSSSCCLLLVFVQSQCVFLNG